MLDICISARRRKEADAAVASLIDNNAAMIQIASA